MRILASLLLAGLVVLGAFWASYGYFRADEVDRASARLSLYRSTVVAELERFSHLTYVLANDPFVIATAGGGDTTQLNERFKSFADRAGIDAIYLMGLDGITQAASNAGTERSFVGQDYSFRPYFQEALNGAQGQFYGIGATTGIPGYFYAELVSSSAGEALGVVAIKINLAPLQESWRDAGEQVILSNADGIALLASNPDWRYRALSTLTDQQVARIRDARQFVGQDLNPLEWSVSGEGTAVFETEPVLYLRRDDLPNDWSLHYFASDAQAVTRSWLVAGALVVMSGLAFILFQVQRTRRIGLALSRSEAEEATLRSANERLAVEIEERKTAERRLQRTQTELERAGRLAALGQLSASVTHELGQPITAMRNHLTVAEMQGADAAVNDKLKGLVDRMEGITKQLKFFSRKGRDKFEVFDLRKAYDAVLDLFEGTFAEAGITFKSDISTQPLMVEGNRLRIEQVMTNLMRNAVDAVEGEASPEIGTCLQGDATGVWFEVSDNGHGLGDQSLEDIKEPFRTTRESGQGMGLGLTISAGIISDHNGTLSATDRPDGGAVFRATLPTAEKGDDAT